MKRVPRARDRYQERDVVRYNQSKSRGASEDGQVRGSSLGKWSVLSRTAPRSNRLAWQGRTFRAPPRLFQSGSEFRSNGTQVPADVTGASKSTIPGIVMPAQSAYL